MILERREMDMRKLQLTGCVKLTVTDPKEINAICELIQMNNARTIVFVPYVMTELDSEEEDDSPILPAFEDSPKLLGICLDCEMLYANNLAYNILGYRDINDYPDLQGIIINEDNYDFLAHWIEADAKEMADMEGYEKDLEYKVKICEEADKLEDYDSTEYINLMDAMEAYCRKLGSLSREDEVKEQLYKIYEICLLNDIRPIFSHNPELMGLKDFRFAFRQATRLGELDKASVEGAHKQRVTMGNPPEDTPFGSSVEEELLDDGWVIEEIKKNVEKKMGNSNGCNNRSDSKSAKQLKQTIFEKFLHTHTPAGIAKELEQYVIGQPELCAATGSFLYYHIMRQVMPELSIRPMLVAGPSGCGKTEVWRVAHKLYGKLVQICIVDSSHITQDGWSGSCKLTDIIGSVENGSILVFDEFDKLCTPSFSAHGVNVAAEIQAEFLKLFEGELNAEGFDSSTAGYVMCGAFESLRKEKQKTKSTTIGFSAGSGTTGEKVDNKNVSRFSEEDYISFGMLTELVGRISSKVEINELGIDEMVQIAKNQHSRVSVLLKNLSNGGMRMTLLDEQIKAAAERSQELSTGARGMLAMLEDEILNGIFETGIGNDNPCKTDKDVILVKKSTRDTAQAVAM